jgi:hypothetical protein
MPNNRIQIWSLQDFMEQYNNMYSWLNNIQVRSSTTTCIPGSTTSRYAAVQQHVLLAQQHPGTRQYSNMYSWLNNIQVRSSTTTCTPGSTTSRYAAIQQHVLLMLTTSRLAARTICTPGSTTSRYAAIQQHVLLMLTTSRFAARTICTPGSTTSRYTAVQQYVLLAQQHPGTQHYNNMYPWLNNIQVRSKIYGIGTVPVPYTHLKHLHISRAHCNSDK